MTYTPDTYGDYKSSVRVASTANVTISAPGATIDGVTMAADDRVLLKDQSTGSENGLYEWNGAASAMTRTRDADEDYEMTAGMMVTVEEGSTNADTTWIVTNDDPIDVGVTTITFGQISGSGSGDTTEAFRRSWYGV